jgi:glycosyltransferase involved in cell wall biosynthesis
VQGHGHSYTLNFGVTHSDADYVCFLDDDDFWIDPQYLQTAHSVLVDDGTTIDVHMSDQAAFFYEKQLPGPIWIEDLGRRLITEGRSPGRHGAFAVTVADLVRCQGFCHLNTIIVRNDLFNAIGGLDEGNRYEHDRDFFLRIIDRAREIRYSPRVVSHHNVPDPAKRANVSTQTATLDRFMYQVSLLQKAILSSSHPEIRRYAHQHMGYVLKKITKELVSENRLGPAVLYGRFALMAQPTIKWALYYLLIYFRSLITKP